MNPSESITLLKEYATRDVGNTERTLALVAIRWILAEPSAVRDPLLTDLFLRANGIHHTSSVAPTRRVTNVLDYFTRSGSCSSIPVAGPRHRIYCDGACQANGRRGARAGFGAIVYGPGGKELEVIARPLDPIEPQTNQRAELRALEWAFGKAMSLPEGADIHTDSEYAIKCFTEWGAMWASKGWRKASGGEVLHQDILREMWEVWKRRGTKIRLHHVAAHTGGCDIHSVGNARADALAVQSLSR